MRAMRETRKANPRKYFIIFCIMSANQSAYGFLDSRLKESKHCCAWIEFILFKKKKKCKSRVAGKYFG
jgi:hypothetical protein